MHQPVHALAPRTEAETYTDLDLELDECGRIHPEGSKYAPEVMNRQKVTNRMHISRVQEGSPMQGRNHSAGGPRQLSR